MDDNEAIFSRRVSAMAEAPPQPTAKQIEVMQKLADLKLSGASEKMQKVLDNMMEDAFAHGAQAAPFIAPIGRQAQDRPRPRPSHSEKLCMRMGWTLQGISHRAKINIIADSGKVFIQGVRSGEPFTLVGNDDNLFPNDELVTQLRILYGDEAL